jgi:hypothetical protein
MPWLKTYLDCTKYEKPNSDRKPTIFDAKIESLTK